MSNQTNKTAYRRHEYSGPRKSRRKVYPALKMHNRDCSDKFYRPEAWRTKKQKELKETKGCVMESPHTTQDHHQLFNLSTAQDTPKTKAYSRSIPKIRYEATACSPICNAVESVTEQEETMDIDWLQPDPDTEVYQLTVRRTSSDNLSRLSGYRIVDLKHVIKWAFQMERHRQSCESSQIEYVCEQRKGFHSVLTFKCTMCNETWQQSTEKEQKINTAFVCATVTAGSDYTQAAQIASLMEIPAMTGKSFRSIKKQLGFVKSRLRQRAMNRKRLSTKKNKTQPDKAYGPEASDPVDIDEVELKRQCELKLLEFQEKPLQIVHIEKVTWGQHDNDMYVTYKSDRLTASQFGMVCKRRKATPCHNHVKCILYKSYICNKDMMYEQQNQHVAKIKFMEHYGKTVRLSGLFIDEEFGFLAASPDGIIEEENAVVEIKCFPSLERKSLRSACKNINFPIHLEDDVLVMNKKHNYYYQVQGQLRITKMNKCYFICFISVTQPLTVIEVNRDEEFISAMMPKLVTFFKTCIMPEIILRRVPKNAKCLDFKE